MTEKDITDAQDPVVQTTDAQDVGAAEAEGSGPKAWAAGAADQVGAAARKSVQATGSAVVAVGGVARKPVAMSIEATASALDTLQASYNKGVDTVFSECPVAAFMLPTGPEADDYLLVFDLDEFLSNLQTGVLVRPKVELWAASPDGHDVGHLAEELAMRFAEDLNVAVEKTIVEGTATVSERQQSESALSREVAAELWGPTLGSAAFWTAMFSAGVVPGLLMLWMKQRPRLVIFGLVGEYLRARSDRATAQKQLGAEVKRLERQFQAQAQSV